MVLLGVVGALARPLRLAEVSAVLAAGRGRLRR
jgi:putative peptidoglycan lipid II flippase